MTQAIRFDDTLDDALVEMDHPATFPLYAEIGVFIPSLALATSPAADENFPTILRVISDTFGHTGPFFTFYPETDNFTTWDEWFTGEGFISVAPVPDAVQVLKAYWDVPNGYANIDGTNMPFSNSHSYTMGSTIAGLYHGEACGVIYITYIKIGSTDGGSDILDFDANTAVDLSAFSSTYGDVSLATLPSGGGDTTPPTLLTKVANGSHITLTYDEDIAFTGPLSQFAITQDGDTVTATAAIVDGANLILTVAPEIRIGSTVLISYTGV